MTQTNDVFSPQHPIWSEWGCGDVCWSVFFKCNTGCSRRWTLVKLCFSFSAVERRRRDKINNWIVTLSKIIPDCSVDSRTGAVSASEVGLQFFFSPKPCQIVLITCVSDDIKSACKTPVFWGRGCWRRLLVYLQPFKNLHLCYIFWPLPYLNQCSVSALLMHACITGAESQIETQRVTTAKASRSQLKWGSIKKYFSCWGRVALLIRFCPVLAQELGLKCFGD